MRCNGLRTGFAILATACGARSLVDVGETSGGTTASQSSVGVATDANEGTDGLVLPEGMIWERRYDGETHNRDVGLCASAPTEDMIVIGGFEVLDPYGSDSRSWLARLDGMGELVWLEQDDDAYDEAVAVTPSGRVLTAGTASALPQGTGALMTTAGHTPDGVEEWRIGEPGSGAYDLAIIDEDVVTVGMTAGTSPTTWLARHDADGAPIFSIPGDPGSGAWAVAADAETIVTAVADIPDGNDVLGVAIRSHDAMTGNPIGTPRYFEGFDPKAIARDANGVVLLAASFPAMMVTRIDETGMLWSDTFGDRSPFLFEWDMTLDAAGYIIVAGSLHETDDRAHLRKYTPDGELTWTREYSTGEEIIVNGVATTPSGDIIMVGEIRGEAMDWDIWISRWSP